MNASGVMWATPQQVPPHEPCQTGTLTRTEMDLFLGFRGQETEGMATRPLIAVGELGGSLCLGRQAARGETRTDLQITGRTAGMAPLFVLDLY